MVSKNIEPFYIELGHWIRHNRELEGLSQSQLAKNIGHTRASIANMEAGKQRILSHQLTSIARALKRGAYAISKAIEYAGEYAGQDKEINQTISKGEKQ